MAPETKGVQFALRSFNEVVSRRFRQPHMRTLSTNVTSGGEVDDKNNSNSFESPDEFEWRIFSETAGAHFRSDAFFTNLGRLGMGRDGQGLNPSGGGGSGSGSHILSGLHESFNTLSDGMDVKLEKAATDFDINYEEINQEDYSFRPDVNFELGMTYDVKILILLSQGCVSLPQGMSLK